MFLFVVHREYTYEVPATRSNEVKAVWRKRYGRYFGSDWAGSEFPPSIDISTSRSVGTDCGRIPITGWTNEAFVVPNRYDTIRWDSHYHSQITGHRLRNRISRWKQEKTSRQRPHLRSKWHSDMGPSPGRALTPSWLYEGNWTLERPRTAENSLWVAKNWSLSWSPSRRVTRRSHCRHPGERRCS